MFSTSCLNKREHQLGIDQVVCIRDLTLLMISLMMVTLRFIINTMKVVPYLFLSICTVLSSSLLNFTVKKVMLFLEGLLKHLQLE